MRALLIACVSVPKLTIGYAFVGVCLALGLVRDPRFRDAGILVATWRPWVANRWQFSTTIGAGMCLHPRHVGNNRIWAHEKVHVRQFEDLCALGLVLCPMVADSWLEAALIWHAAPVGLLLNYATSALRHGLQNAYRQAEHERAAYDHTD